MFQPLGTVSMCLSYVLLAIRLATFCPTRNVISPTDPAYGGLVTRVLDQFNMIPVGNVSQGGFIIVGKEQYSKSDCDLKDVDYSSTELKFAAAQMGDYN